MIFDAHGDILTDIYEQIKQGNTHPFKDRHLSEYNKGGITHSIFVNYTHPTHGNKTVFNDIFDIAIPYLKKHNDIFHIIESKKDFTSSSDTIGVILGIEGIKYLDGVHHLQELYNKGVRHASLTWNDINDYATGLDDEKNSKGLTTKGKTILNEMERLGMIIDLAHLNERSFFDVLNATSGPVIISHGNTKALCNHKRNYTDKQLHAIKTRDGVIGICGIAPFLSENPENHTVKQMANHIDYAVQTIGIDHVGIGFDVCFYLYDNVEHNHVKGFKTIGDAPNLFIELNNMGYSFLDIEKIKYKNFKRIIDQIL